MTSDKIDFPNVRFAQLTKRVATPAKWYAIVGTSERDEPRPILAMFAEEGAARRWHDQVSKDFWSIEEIEM